MILPQKCLCKDPYPTENSKKSRENCCLLTKKIQANMECRWDVCVFQICSVYYWKLESLCNPAVCVCKCVSAGVWQHISGSNEPHSWIFGPHHSLTRTKTHTYTTSWKKKQMYYSAQCFHCCRNVVLWHWKRIYYWANRADGNESVCEFNSECDLDLQTVCLRLSM